MTPRTPRHLPTRRQLMAWAGAPLLTAAQGPAAAADTAATLPGLQPRVRPGAPGWPMAAS